MRRKTITSTGAVGPPPGAPHTLLSVEDLSVRFNTEDGVVQAVSNVSFAIKPREVFCIVGESGSGKTVTAMSILGLLPTPPAEIIGGKIMWAGEDLLVAPPDRLRKVRGGEIGMIFQDPLTALNPVHSVGSQIIEVLRAHGNLNRKEARAQAIEALDLVGIPQARTRV